MHLVQRRVSDRTSWYCKDSNVETDYRKRLDRYPTISAYPYFPPRNRKEGSVKGDGKHAEPRHLLLAREPVQILSLGEMTNLSIIQLDLIPT